jgi:Zn-dependent protease with chaperone function
VTLGYLARLVVQMLAAYAVISTVAAVAVWWWARVSRLSHPSPPSARADVLFTARLTPAVTGLFVAGVLVPVSYLLWEPRHDSEVVGDAAVLMALAGAGLLASGAWRAVRAALGTARIRRTLVAASSTPRGAHDVPATIVESAFPIVALVGLVAPRIFLARSVLEACTAAELNAVVAHERAHAAAHDNLRRLALIAAPDVLAWHPLGAELVEAWALEAELAADAGAAHATATPLDLASALIKVARLAADRSDPLPASALYRGEAITERVQRLVQAPPAAVATIGITSRTRAVRFAMMAATGIAAMPWLHRLLEAIIRLGA